MKPVDINVVRVETHVINKNHRLYKYCDDVCFKSKNLYNYVNYIIRQEFINNGKMTSPFDLNKSLKNEEIFKALPSKTSQQIIIGLGNNWKSFFRSIKEWGKNKQKYQGRPELPKYKKKNGRNVVYFDYQQGTLKDGKYKFPKTDKFIETKVTKDSFRQVQIIPYGSCYKISIVYKKKLTDFVSANGNCLAIDLGVDNLATLTNNIGLQPIVINGKIIKSRNNFYNKKLARLMSYVGKKSSNRIKKLSLKRNNIFATYFHKISRYVINYCIDNDIHSIIVGKNKNWKQKSKLSKKVNQKFVQIPYEMLINQLIYKAEEVGIKVEIVSEEYTSKASFIDNDSIPSKMGKYDFSGKRIKRGLYKSKEGIIINADVNGSYNILRKCNSQFKYDERIKGVSLYPIRVNII